MTNVSDLVKDNIAHQADQIAHSKKFVHMEIKNTELLVVNSSKFSEASGGGAYIEYQYSGNRVGNWVRLDVGKVIKANQENWLKSIGDWHRRLCVRGAQKSKFWWLNNASRLMVWVPFDLRPLLYARAILDICGQEGYSRIHLFGMPSEIIQYLAEWEDSSCANYRLIGATKLILKNTSIVWLLARTFLQFARLLFAWLISIRPVDKSARSIDLVVYSTPLTAQTILSKGDHYFGRIFDGIDRSKIKLEWLYDTSDCYADLSTIKKALRDTGRDFCFALGHLTIADLFAIGARALYELIQLRLIANRTPSLILDAIPCTEFVANFSRQCIFTVPPVWEIASLYAFRRYLKLVKPKAIIYPYEEKGRERALIQACNAADPKIVSIAFAHAVMCRGHLYLHNCQDIQRPSPRYIAVTGAATRNWLNSWAGQPLERLRVIGTPNYIAQGDIQCRERQPREARHILFLCGIGHEISRLVYFATNRPDIFANSVLRVRKYPYSWQEQQDEDISRLREIGTNVVVNNQELDEEIQWADVVLFTTTSASLEAMLRNRLCIRLVDGILDTNPLAGRDSVDAVPNCNTAEELRDCLGKIFNSNDQDYRVMIDAQRKIAVGIYSEWNNSLWEMVGIS